ncbi:hypothetical protein [Bacillus rubiinfantis]|uniref:hypothetical protein n=1 Tax=Bacillus rubiinfantis TaxID=1499680 RepID=UPI0005A973EB|nr:hypothetical protein [Bacillus rubiinfantis]
MLRGNKKALLVVIGDGSAFEAFGKQLTDGYREDIILIRSSSAFLAPFDDVMREIILTVYQEGIAEILVTTTKVSSEEQRLSEQILENQQLQQNIQTLDYLFRNCHPEFPSGTIRQWLLGGSHDSITKCLQVIQEHPLLPRHVKVRKFQVDEVI